MAYLKVLGCLGTALVELLGGEGDFKVVCEFEVGLVVGFTLIQTSQPVCQSENSN